MTQPGTREPRWGWIYALVLGVLALDILLLYLFGRVFA